MPIRSSPRPGTAGARRVDEPADHEHERVHPDDVEADHGEDVRLVVPVVDHQVAGQVHHRDHHGEAGDRGNERRQHAGAAEDLAQRRRLSLSVPPASKCSCRAIVRGSGRTQRTSTRPTTMIRSREPRHDESSVSSSSAKSGRKTSGPSAAPRARRRARTRSRGRGARAGTCRPPQPGRAGSSRTHTDEGEAGDHERRGVEGAAERRREAGDDPGHEAGGDHGHAAEAVPQAAGRNTAVRRRRGRSPARARGSPRCRSRRRA